MKIVQHFTVDNRAVTRYANNLVEVYRYSPNGREMISWSHTYFSSEATEMGFNVKKQEIMENA